MVYCGKASQGCQNCRIRRIKCDKVNPECSQCIRVGKKCPGYRDQLSLMFRDESTKVIKKAHAQWGVSERAEIGDCQPSASNTSSPLSSSSSSSSSPAHSRKSTPNSAKTISQPAVATEIIPVSNPAPSASSLSPTRLSVGSSSPAVLPIVKREGPPSSPTRHIGSTLQEQGVLFYIHRYLIGHPDEAKSGQELSREGWIWHPAVQDVMSAVGLAGLSNLTGNADMMATAREKYGSALRQTGKLIHPSQAPIVDVTMRAVVGLAMFELVKGTHSTSNANAHVMGGAALMRNWCPMPSVPFAGSRALLQLCYSMYIPLHVAAMPMPPEFYDWVSFGSHLQLPFDQPATSLAVLIARFVEISSDIQNHIISDGKPKAAKVLQQLLELDSKLESWEAGLQGEWLFETIHAAHLPPQAVFRGEYHKYYDIWTARIWNYYRWARILVEQNLLDLTDKNPLSSLPLVSAAARGIFLVNIKRLAKDTLVSAPTHWRHPALDGLAQIRVESLGGGGAGAAGLPALLFHLKVAGCAPGTPKEYWQWALRVIETVWGDMGMLHARSMMEAMRAHRETVLRSGAAGILADDR